jgi:hypothetical protein
MQVAVGAASTILACTDALTGLPRKVVECWYFNPIWMSLHHFSAYARFASSTAFETEISSERSWHAATIRATTGITRLADRRYSRSHHCSVIALLFC